MKKTLIFILGCEIFSSQLFGAGLILEKVTQSLNQGAVPISVCQINIENQTKATGIMMIDRTFPPIKIQEFDSILDTLLAKFSYSKHNIYSLSFKKPTTLDVLRFLYQQIAQQEFKMIDPEFDPKRGGMGDDALAISWRIKNNEEEYFLRSWGYGGFGKIDSIESKILISFMDRLCVEQYSVDVLPTVELFKGLPLGDDNPHY